MTNRSINLDDRLYAYLLEQSSRENDIMRRLRERTASHELARMQIAPEQAQFMALLIELIGARRIIEIGTFTGYSAMAMAQALPADGQLICCDISAEWTDIGRLFWQEAGVESRIDLRIAPALETLDDLIEQGQQGRFDMAFIDADKTAYADYYERCLVLLRTGGLVLIDNVLWSGRVIDDEADDEDTRAIRAFNEQLHHDRRASLSLLPLGDGLTLAMKRS
jgi:O-methyltransferase